MVEFIAERLVRPAEVMEVWETVEDDVLRVHVRLASHGATGAFVGRSGEIVNAVSLLAKYSARGRYRDVRLQVERDHLVERSMRPATTEDR